MPQATGDGRRNHLLSPNLIVGLFISLFFILEARPLFISFTSQAFTPLLVGLKTMPDLMLVLLLFVTVCVLLTINNSDNTGSYNRNDEHACNNSGDDLVCPHSQQRESKLHQDVMIPGTPWPQADARHRQDVMIPGTPWPRTPWPQADARHRQDVMIPGTPWPRTPWPQADARHRQDVMIPGTPWPQADARHRRKPVSPVKPSATAAQKPPLPDKKVRSNKVDDQDVMRPGTPSPSPQADACRRKPVSPVKPSSTAAQKPPLLDKKVRSNKVDDQDVMRPGSCSSESSCSTPLPPPQPWWFTSPPHERTTYVLVNSPSCDSADSINVRADHYIKNFWISLS